MTRILIAMQREADALGVWPVNLVGIGATDLPKTTEGDTLISIGYCGSNVLPVGMVVSPGRAIDADTGEAFSIDRTDSLPDFPCYTASGFVTEDISGEPCIYDMELAKVARLPHRRLVAIKIVSDNLSLAQCESFNNDGAWRVVRRVLAEVIPYGSTRQTKKGNR